MNLREQPTDLDKWEAQQRAINQVRGLCPDCRPKGLPADQAVPGFISVEGHRCAMCDKWFKRPAKSTLFTADV